MPDPLSNLDVSKKGSISKIDPVTIPGFVPDSNKAFDNSKHRVRYSKIDLDDLGSIAELEILETKALRNEGVYILSKERFSFMDKMFIVVQYIERVPDGS